MRHRRIESQWAVQFVPAHCSGLGLPDVIPFRVEQSTSSGSCTALHCTAHKMSSLVKTRLVLGKIKYSLASFLKLWGDDLAFFKSDVAMSCDLMMFNHVTGGAHFTHIIA